MDVETHIPEARPAPPQPAIEEVGGRRYMTDAKGNLVPLENVRTTDQLMDAEVRRIMGYAEELSAQIARFKQHTLNDVAGLLGLFAQEYETELGGRKGNVTLKTFDGLQKVQLAIADRVTFGPELQAAKALVDECLTEWAADGRPELRAVVTRAFNTDKEGLVNRAELFSLLRLEIEDPRWRRAMKALRDSITVEGTKEYVRFYRRASANQRWVAVTIDVAAA